MNFNLVIDYVYNIPIPDFLNETNSMEIIDLDNDYLIIDNIYNEQENIYNKHIYVLNSLRNLGWELRRIYHSINAYYQINFNEETEYVNYIIDSLKISIYYHYRNDVINNNNNFINENNINDDDNVNLLEDTKNLNIKNYNEIDNEIKTKYNDCGICYENFNEDTKIVLLNCLGNHIYCHDCIVNWLKNYNNKCPICKSDIE